MAHKKRRSQLANCKRHPKHKQSPGVCSLCLREKLSHLQSSSTSRSLSIQDSCCSTTSSLSSYYSSCSSTSSTSYISSPLRRYRFSTREGHNYHDKGSSSTFSLSSVLRKSRSLAFVPNKSRSKDMQACDDGKNKKIKKKKDWFLSKFIYPRRKTSTIHEDGLGQH
ncbi:hypothetical protein ACFE04_025956 [Oxalis oulophora]